LPRKTPENTVKHRGGSVGSVVANHRGGGETSMVVTTLLTNLLTFLDKVLHSVNEGYPVDVVFLDLAKAFDKVRHQSLLEKLKKHGIRGKLLSVIIDWLSNSKQRICIKGRWSSWISVWSGFRRGLY